MPEITVEQYKAFEEKLFGELKLSPQTSGDILVGDLDSHPLPIEVMGVKGYVRDFALNRQGRKMRLVLSAPLPEIPSDFYARMTRDNGDTVSKLHASTLLSITCDRDGEDWRVARGGYQAPTVSTLHPRKNSFPRFSITMREVGERQWAHSIFWGEQKLRWDRSQENPEFVNNVRFEPKFSLKAKASPPLIPSTPSLKTVEGPGALPQQLAPLKWIQEWQRHIKGDEEVLWSRYQNLSLDADDVVERLDEPSSELGIRQSYLSWSPKQDPTFGDHNNHIPYLQEILFILQEAGLRWSAPFLREEGEGYSLAMLSGGEWLPLQEVQPHEDSYMSSYWGTKVRKEVEILSEEGETRVLVRIDDGHSGLFTCEFFPSHTTFTICDADTIAGERSVTFKAGTKYLNIFDQSGDYRYTRDGNTFWLRSAMRHGQEHHFQPEWPSEETRPLHEGPALSTKKESVWRSLHIEGDRQPGPPFTFRKLQRQDEVETPEGDGFLFHFLGERPSRTLTEMFLKKRRWPQCPIMLDGSRMPHTKKGGTLWQQLTFPTGLTITWGRGDKETKVTVHSGEQLIEVQEGRLNEEGELVELYRIMYPESLGTSLFRVTPVEPVSVRTLFQGNTTFESMVTPKFSKAVRRVSGKVFGDDTHPGVFIKRGSQPYSIPHFFEGHTRYPEYLEVRAQAEHLISEATKDLERYRDHHDTVALKRARAVQSRKVSVIESAAYRKAASMMHVLAVHPKGGGESRILVQVGDTEVEVKKEDWEFDQMKLKYPQQGTSYLYDYEGLKEPPKEPSALKGMVTGYAIDEVMRGIMAKTPIPTKMHDYVTLALALVALKVSEHNPTAVGVSKNFLESVFRRKMEGMAATLMSQVPTLVKDHPEVFKPFQDLALAAPTEDEVLLTVSQKEPEYVS